MQSEQIDVVSLNRGRNLAILSNDACVPITNYFDEDGDECDEEDACTCVCGDDSNGWFAVDLSVFKYRPPH